MLISRQACRASVCKSEVVYLFILVPLICKDWCDLWSCNTDVTSATLSMRAFEMKRLTMMTICTSQFVRLMLGTSILLTQRIVHHCNFHHLCCSSVHVYWQLMKQVHTLGIAGTWLMKHVCESRSGIWSFCTVLSAFESSEWLVHGKDSCQADSDGCGYQLSIKLYFKMPKWRHLFKAKPMQSCMQHTLVPGPATWLNAQHAGSSLHDATQICQWLVYFRSWSWSCTVKQTLSVIQLTKCETWQSLLGHETPSSPLSYDCCLLLPLTAKCGWLLLTQ